MSADLEVWSVEKFMGSHGLPRAVEWKAEGTRWVFGQRNWQIVIDESAAIEEEDIPPEIAPNLVGIQFLTRLALEPLHAPHLAHRFFRQVSRTVAKMIRGVVFNPEIGLEYEPSSGRLARRQAPQDEPVKRLSMNWWFADGPLTTREGATKLLAYMETYVPEFLPRRYGEYEPPKYRFEKQNQDHFLDMLFGTDFLVWYSTSLFDVSYNPKHGPSWRRHGFSMAQLTLQCPASLLTDPGWSVGLRRCWNAITRLAVPVYGDVRILGGYIVRGNRVWSNASTERHPVRTWRGLPATFGLAVAIGEPYLSLWPGLRNESDPSESPVVIRSVADWNSGHEITDEMEPPPERLCQPGGSEDKRLAEVWPFDR